MPLAAILAGGEGRRFGPTPKPLAELAGRPLLGHVRDRLRAQAATVVLCLRAPAPWAEAFGLPVVYDAARDVGPMGGVAAALQWARETHPAVRWVLTCPADCPFVPDDFAENLVAALGGETRIAVAASGGRRHHLAAAWDVSLAEAALAAVRSEGALAVHRFQARHGVAEVSWPTQPVDPFLNVNSAADLTTAEGYLQSLDRRSAPHLMGPRG